MMNDASTLDPHAFFLAQPIIHGVAALWLLMVARTGRHVEGLSLWGLSNALLGAGLILLGVYWQDQVPLALSLATILVLSGYLVAHGGVLQFVHRPLRDLFPLALLCLAAFGLQLYFLHASLDGAMRLAIVSATLGILATVTAWRLLAGVEQEVWPAALAVASACLLWAGFCLFRAVWTLLAPGPFDPIAGDAVQSAAAPISMIVALSTAMGYLWLAGMRLEGELYRQSRRDSLTGIINHRGLWEAAPLEVDRARRYGYPLSALLLDLDRFKSLNDRYGHAAGDKVLAMMAGAVQLLLRRTDILARAGGEEFVILLPVTGKTDAMAAGERIRSVVAGLRITHGNATLGITVSIGVSTLGEDGDSWEQLLGSADRALYAAKDAGRDRVMAAVSAVDATEKPASAPAA